MMVSSLNDVAGRLIGLNTHLVSCLNGKGVSASVSDTLWVNVSKINQISNNGVGFSSILLSSAKDIVVINESCVLTAQLKDSNNSNVSVSGVNILFKVYDADDNLLTTLHGTTNSNGAVTVSYTCSGDGDVSVVADANGIFSNETYIENVLFYDNAQSNMLTSYDNTYLTDATITYDNVNKQYELLKTNNDGWSTILANTTLGDNLEVSCDFKLINVGNVQPRIVIFNKGTGNGVKAVFSPSSISVSDGVNYNADTPTSFTDSANGSFNNNDFYHLVLRIEDGVITFTVENTIVSATNTSILSSDNNVVGVQHAYSATSGVLFKNLKIKEL